MENNKYLNQSLLILIASICVIVLLLIYSYNNKFNDNVIEGFDINFERDINSEEIVNLNTLSSQLSNINKLKSEIYNDYSGETVQNYQDVLKLNPEVFDFDNKLYSMNFYQSLQDNEITDLNNKYNQLKSELSVLPTKSTTTFNKIKHIASGSVFNTNGNPFIEEFNIILNNSNSMCLEFKSLDSDYKNINPSTIINNIDTVPCDYGSINRPDDYIKNQIKKQKFSAVKITNNDNYNKNLHDIYSNFRIPEDNTTTNDFSSTLNNYPYYIIKPSYNTNNNICLTLKNNMLSIEPCDGSDKQKFELINLDY